MNFRAGIIGTGSVAGMGLGATRGDGADAHAIETSHAGGYAAHDAIDLVAVADIDEGNRTAFADRWEVPRGGRYATHSAMLSSEDLDVVSVCTPTSRHAEHVVDAARSEASPAVIWCEKPLATSVEDGERMIEACSETETDLLVNHTFRFDEKLAEFRSFLRSGGLGEVLSVHARYREELLRNATHLLDTLVYLFDADISWVSGYVSGQDAKSGPVIDAGGGGHLMFDGGPFVTLDCTVPRRESSMCYDFVGTRGKVSLNNDDGEWRYWELVDGGHVERPFPVTDGTPWSWERDYRAAFAAAAGHAVDLITAGAGNRSSGREALRSLAPIVALFVSSRSGSRIHLPLDPPLRSVTVRSE